MHLKTISGICLIAMSVVILPFVSVAKSPKTHANGVLVCECCGQENCDCCDQRPTQTIQKVAECGFSRPIRVATMVNNRPFGWAEWRTQNGKRMPISRGYGINMFTEIAEKLKLRYQIVGYTTDQDAITDLKRGNLDLLIGVYTPASTVGKNSTTVYPAMFANMFSVHYLKDKAFDVRGDESLNGRKGVMRRSENVYPLFSARITPAMSISLETTEASFQKLLSGEADYLIGSPYSIEAELRRYKLQNDIVSSSKSLMQAAMFMVLSNGTDCFKLKTLLGEGIAAYNADANHAHKELIRVIDDWGEQFKDAPKLTGVLSHAANDTDVTSDASVSHVD